jgi:AraC family transcriptional regulator
VPEPLIFWVYSGTAEIQERENEGPWITTTGEKGSLFLTTAGAPYDCRWKTLSAERFEIMVVLVSLPLMQSAFAEVFGRRAGSAKLRDISGFTDPHLDWLWQRLHDELRRRSQNSLTVQAVSQLIAVHLARTYADGDGKPQATSPSLPGHKLQQLMEWMNAHVADDLNLEQLAARVGVSKFHFQRLFKSGAGMSPARYHIKLRIDCARRLLRETKKSVVEIAAEVGYTNPSYFSQILRRECGVLPPRYRRMD